MHKAFLSFAFLFFMVGGGHERSAMEGQVVREYHAGERAWGTWAWTEVRTLQNRDCVRCLTIRALY